MLPTNGSPHQCRWGGAAFAGDDDAIEQSVTSKPPYGRYRTVVHAGSAGKNLEPPMNADERRYTVRPGDPVPWAWRSEKY